MAEPNAFAMQTAGTDGMTFALSGLCMHTFKNQRKKLARGGVSMIALQTYVTPLGFA